MEPLPLLHESGLDARDLLSLADIARIPGSPKYAALRSYSTGRRYCGHLGEMPKPVARIGQSRLWHTYDIQAWLEPVARLHRGHAAWVESRHGRGTQAR